MFILVKRNCLSAHGEIFRRGEVVEVDDEAGKAQRTRKNTRESISEGKGKIDERQKCRG